MTTITLSERTERNDGRYCVFGTHQDSADRFVFAVQSFADLAAAERYARRLMDRHQADHFERIR